MATISNKCSLFAGKLMVVESINKMLKEKQLCDVLNGKEFDVDKVVLASRSPVFSAMFNNQILKTSLS